MAAARAPMNNWQKGALGVAGGASIMPFFSKQPDFKNPSNAAMPYLDQIPESMRPYFQPYMDAGKDAMGKLQGQYGEMTNDPGGLYSRIGAGYKQSPGYQFKLHQALMAGDNAAAAGGMAGSPLHQQGNMQLANDISSQDFNDYMKNVLGIYGNGISGEQNLNTQGYDASKDFGNSIGQNWMNKAGLAYQGENAQNEYNQNASNSSSDMWGNIAGLAMNAFKFL